MAPALALPSAVLHDPDQEFPERPLYLWLLDGSWRAAGHLSRKAIGY
jgi:hypothetical protein